MPWTSLDQRLGEQRDRPRRRRVTEKMGYIPNGRAAQEPGGDTQRYLSDEVQDPLEQIRVRSAAPRGKLFRPGTAACFPGSCGPLGRDDQARAYRGAVSEVAMPRGYGRLQDVGQASANITAEPAADRFGEPLPDVLPIGARERNDGTAGDPNGAMSFPIHDR